jgi:Pentapeptide repeats (8 copies)
MSNNSPTAPECPVSPDVQKWIEARFDWLIDQFGIERLQSINVILPTEDFFPNAYRPTPESVRMVFHRVCDYVGIDWKTIELHFYEDIGQRTRGLYEPTSEKHRVWIEAKMLDDPLALVGTMAHELAHMHLLGHRRVTPEAEDHEPLTDLLTVFLGMGVITANAVIRESHWHAGTWAGWSISRGGYLTMPMYGYALALFARARGEEQPPWAKSLRADVLSDFQKAQRYLEVVQYTPNLSRPIPPFPRNEVPNQASGEEEEEENVQPASASAEAEDDNKPPTNAESLLRRYKLGQRDFQNADLNSAVLRGMDLRNCDLTAADLYGANLTKAVLMKAVLRDADLRFAVLRQANLRGADLRGADLSGANLSEANLRETDIRGTDFSGAHLRGARLGGAARDRSTEFAEVDFGQIECDSELRAEMQSQRESKEIFAGSYRGKWRLLILLPISGVAALLGCFAGVAIPPVVRSFLGYRPRQDAGLIEIVCALSGAAAAGVFTFWRLTRPRQ